MLSNSFAGGETRCWQVGLIDAKDPGDVERIPSGFRYLLGNHVAGAFGAPQSAMRANAGMGGYLTRV
jgi:hypothetical protein